MGEEDRGAGEGKDGDDDQRADQAAAEPRRGGEHAEVGEESRPDQAVGKPRVDAPLPAAAELAEDAEPAAARRERAAGH
jgi:hypothetical protein